MTRESGQLGADPALLHGLGALTVTISLVGLPELCVQQSPRGAPRGFGAVSQGLSLQKGGAECPWEAVIDGLGNHGGSCDCQR